VKDEYQDFTAYFNTYYNGEQAYQSALTDVKKSLMDYNINLISGLPVSQFAISPTAHQNFDIAIEKASKVLQLYPNSGYTESCLFMIGISYFYEGDYLRSGRKFIEEQSKYPDSKRFCEALMYYGDIEVKNRNMTNGYGDLLKAMKLADMEQNRQVMAQTSEYLSDYFLMQSDTATAAQYLDSAATFARNDDAAIYACRSGNLYEISARYDDAKREYSLAWDYARDITVKFYSKYFLARAERHVKQYGAALANLEYLRNDDKYFQYFPLIEYQKAEALYDSGSVSTAFADFQRIDTAYATNEAATRSAFRVANIYLYKIGDYQSALKYYQKSAAHVAVPGVSEKARQMSSNLQEYFTNLFKLNLADSLYLRMVDAASRNDSTIRHSQEDIDSLYEHVADAQEAMAGFFLFKLQIPDSAINHYSTIVSQFKNSRVYPSALYTLGEYYFSTGDTANAKNYLTELINEHRESSFALSASSLLGMAPRASVDSVQIGYDHAINLENENLHDSAIVVLKGLLGGKKRDLTPKALYTIGWIYENKLNIPDSAFSYYKRLSLEYPASNYSANLNLTLSGYEQAQRDSAEARKRVADSIANALKPVARDTVRESREGSPLNQKVDSLDSQKELKKLPAHPGIAMPDSTEVRRETAVDSAAIRRKQLEEPKKPER
jgi:tetratricopeptide (TPR) repeat protein